MYCIKVYRDKRGRVGEFWKNRADNDELTVNLKRQAVEEPYSRVLGLSSIENIPSVRAWNQRVEAAAAATAPVAEVVAAVAVAKNRDCDLFIRKEQYKPRVMELGDNLANRDFLNREFLKICGYMDVFNTGLLIRELVITSGLIFSYEYIAGRRIRKYGDIYRALETLSMRCIQNDYKNIRGDGITTMEELAINYSDILNLVQLQRDI